MKRLATTTKAITKSVIDPVCGMNVPPGNAELVNNYQGRSYYFCAEACRKAFEVSPQKYLAPKSAKVMGPKGWWGRYLERMARSNRELFGDSRPQCH